jgi:hypothetical protein
MKSSKPPTLATWMLEHLMPGGGNEALAGDLLEEFQRRRSIPWYWRQVLGAILVSISKELRDHWVTFSAQFAFATVWIYYAYFDVVLDKRSIMWQMAYVHYGWAIWILFWALLCLAAPLSVYLVVVRNLSLRAFKRGLRAGVIAWAAVMLLGITRISPDMRTFPASLQRPYIVLLGSFPLLVAMWGAKSCKRTSRATAIPS